MNKLVAVSVLAIAISYVYFCDDGFDPSQLRGKRVLITGSSSGIGEHLAYEYSKLGAKVMLAARRQELLKEVARKCKEFGAQEVGFVTSDLAEQEDRDSLIVEVKKRFGGLDHLILNHAVASMGIWLGSRENMTRLLMDMDINFISYVDLASQALPMLTESKGNIGVVSSVLGKYASAGSATYTTCKHALQGFFSALRQELLLRQTGVSVTTCVIGSVDTEILQLSKTEIQALLDEYFLGFNVLVTAEDTAVAIMKGVANRKYEIHFGRLAWVLTTMHKVSPGFFEDFIGWFSMVLLKLL